MGLFDFIIKPIQSALTPPGTNAAEDARKKMQQPSNIAGGLLNSYSPTLTSQFQFANATEPLRQRSLWDMIHQAGPGGAEQLIANARRGFVGDAIANLPYVEQALSSSGHSGIGAIEGARVAALNQANSRANDLAAWYSSPEGMQARSGLINWASSQAVPGLGNLGYLSEIIAKRPVPQVGASPIAGLANLAATYYSGGFGGSGGLLGGGGGGVGGVGSNTSNSSILPAPVRAIP